MGCILAVGGSKPTVTVDAKGRFGVEKQMTINLTADHRIIYGADAAGGWGGQGDGVWVLIGYP
jgi:pyruvate dehydrogenase E2 component (dihydrolipoamide acetyltransferase)